MDSNEYKPKASAKVRTRYHIVLVTKYRKRALEGIEEDAIASIREAEQRSRFTIHRINTGDGNHVHMLVSIPPDETISGTVSRIKQLTTHELWGKHPDHLRRYYWGKHHKLWSAGYYCETVGRNSESIIERYIDEQQQAGRFIRDTEDDAAFSPKQKRSSEASFTTTIFRPSRSMNRRNHSKPKRVSLSLCSTIRVPQSSRLSNEVSRRLLSFNPEPTSVTDATTR